MSGAWSNDQLNALFVYDTSGNLILTVTETGIAYIAPARRFDLDTTGLLIQPDPADGGHLLLTTDPSLGAVMLLKPVNSTVPGATFTARGTVYVGESTGSGSQPFLALVSPAVNNLTRGRIDIYGESTAGDPPQIDIDATSVTVTGNLSVDGEDIGAGYRDDASATASTAALSAETVVLTIAAFTFEDGRAYKITMIGGMTSSADGIYSDFRVKKTNTAGAQITEFYRFRGNGANVVDCTSVRYCKNNTGADVGVDVVLTMNRVGGAGTVTGFATAANPRALIIEDCGTATQYAFAPSV